MLHQHDGIHFDCVILQIDDVAKMAEARYVA